MSKKIAEGTAALVLDVKVGAAAFMQDIDGRARELAATMVELGTRARGAHQRAADQDGRPRSAGRRATRVEVAESVATLRGDGPADLVEVTLALATEMLALAGVNADPARRAGRRPGAGQVPGDDRGPGRRP